MVMERAEAGSMADPSRPGARWTRPKRPASSRTFAGADGGARWARPPRHQAGQHLPDRRPHGQVGRLRAGSMHGPERRERDPRRSGRGDPFLHEPRTVPVAAGRCLRDSDAPGATYYALLTGRGPYAESTTMPLLVYVNAPHVLSPVLSAPVQDPTGSSRSLLPEPPLEFLETFQSHPPQGNPHLFHPNLIPERASGHYRLNPLKRKTSRQDTSCPSDLLSIVYGLKRCPDGSWASLDFLAQLYESDPRHSCPPRQIVLR